MPKHLIVRMAKLAERIEAKRGLRAAMRMMASEARARGDSAAVFKVMQALAALPLSSSRSRHRRVCQVTGKSRGCYKFFGLGRQELLRSLNKGLLFGLRRVSDR